MASCLRLRHLSPSAAAHHHHRLPNSSAQLRFYPSSCLAGARPLRLLPPLRSRLPRVYALSSNDIRVGSNLEVDGAPWKVLGLLGMFSNAESFLY
uniref:Uncharacterized protein n=1 Tax=Oryza meridionalis TaxID=40149 RepID=A0A0E0F8Z0_9ORYZ